ncbi:hypothetical protein PGT21_028556 [Puccinia graminis f. sp. tritici]|uniref:RanBD1 domain-containing protein n=1 Tax=Puccinia graminis f. sp. tritici TaxID=56615 RepID=A0A5B0PZ46_PUCGR|nr:hypothetical protein PGT21_028556 [Puccinia graminis f. sp. tritici]KAA1109147.1 hypothetical protein PGTUg99_002430 [Puccinia graminis f. sp. tritici]
MVKRQAEKQLTDRNCDDVEPDDTPSTGVLKTASLQAISKRQIRALPKKTGASVSKPTSQFGAVPPFPANGKPASTLFGQAPQSFNPTPSFNLFGGSSSFGTTKPTALGTAPSAMSNSPNSTDPSNKQELITYYSSLRGLNLSVTKAFEELIKKDAFMDLGSAFDHVKQKYNEHRREIEAQLERSQPSQTDKAITSVTAEAPVKSPFNFASNEAPKVSSTGPTLSAGGEARTTPSLFSFSPSNAQKSSEGSSSVENPTVSAPEVHPSSDEADNLSLPSANGSAAPGAKAGSRPGAFTMAAPMRPSPLRYESQTSPADSPAPESAEEPAKSAFSLAPITQASKPESSLSSTANTADQQPNPKEANPDDSSTATLPLSDSKSKTSSLFGVTGPSAAGTSAPSPFFTSKPLSYTSLSAQNSTAKPSSIGFSFGVGAAGNGSAFGAFGSPKSAPGQATPPKNAFNPVGFSFGSSPPTSSVFSTPKPSENTSTEPGSTNIISTSTGNEKPDAGSENLAGEEGSDDLGTSSTEAKAVDSKKGEEDEETLFETTGRVYALLDKKQEDGKVQKGWVGWAICNVRLNRHKETQRCRILARSQVNQGILINFFVRPDLKPEDRGNSLEVLGFNPEGSHLQAYRVRPASDQVVKDFHKAITEVVESLSKS